MIVPVKFVQLPDSGVQGFDLAVDLRTQRQQDIIGEVHSMVDGALTTQ
ncbi:hypothetical protein [Cryobacterium sp. GrIS_2_6]|nr:hypothetical protein [Cryobacterium psychrotolerans]